jgi:hypothetical protein
MALAAMAASIADPPRASIWAAAWEASVWLGGGDSVFGNHHGSRLRTFLAMRRAWQSTTRRYKTCRNSDHQDEHA